MKKSVEAVEPSSRGSVTLLLLYQVFAIWLKYPRSRGVIIAMALYYSVVNVLLFCFLVAAVLVLLLNGCFMILSYLLGALRTGKSRQKRRKYKWFHYE